MRLVIAEKPSVAQAIAGVLGAKERRDGCICGGGWIVSWCVGHLVELAPADAYDERFAKWVYGDLPILPERWRFVVREGKKKQLDVLRRLMNDKDTEDVICATDAGREGQLIFQLVYEQCKCKKPVQRLWISSMEDAAIREGFGKLRPGAAYDRLYRAALCRSQADWLVGINATRLFSCLYGGVTLNVGRVQTPTLALITAREAEIAAFVTEPFYTPEIDAGGFTASGEKLTDPVNAEAIRTACDGMDAVVRSAERQEKTAAPPKLYDLTTLQREANRLFGFTAQQTLDYTQSLYEKKLVTYPRTDSRFLTEDMRGTAGSIINWLQINTPFAKGIAFAPDMARITDNSKVTDHHAIIPTMGAAQADLAALPAGERDVFCLIAVRLLCATAPAHTFETVTAVLECGGHHFTAKGKSILRGGWKAIDDAFRVSLKNKPDDCADEVAALPELSVGQGFPSVAASVREGKTAPPKRFTEDSLLAAMETAGSGDMPEERRGLGTPATRAAVIERLVKSGFIERKKKQLAPTQKGINLITVLPDVLASPALTAEWEHKLGMIEKGELDDKAFMDGIAAMTRKLVEDHPAPCPEYEALFVSAPGNNTVTNRDGIIGVCPRCGGGVIERPKGFFCSNKPCSFAIWKNSRFFEAKRKNITKAVAAALLKDGRVFMSGLYSEKTEKTYDAAVILEDTGKYVNFRLEFEKR